MNPIMTNITPDSLSGILFALEGVDKICTLLNGPTGCKFYHSAISDNQRIFQHELDPMNHHEDFFFGQPRIPSTYLDKRDYVYGSRDKLNMAIKYIEANFDYEMICIVNSPGAALIGDDLEGILSSACQHTPYMTIQTPGFSENISTGYEYGVISLLEKLSGNDQADNVSTGSRSTKSPHPTMTVNDCQDGQASILSSLNKKNQEPVVNLLGLPIYKNYYDGDIKEITRLLGMCGIKVASSLCSDCSLEDIRNLKNGALNIVVDREYGEKTAKWLYDHTGVKYFVSPCLPIGFEETEKFIKSICHVLNCSDAPFIEEAERARALAYIQLSRLNSLTGLPRGVGFAVKGSYNQCFSYSNFLIRYLGMIPRAFLVDDPEVDFLKNDLNALLEERHMASMLSKDFYDEDFHIAIADGSTIAKLKLLKKEFSGIENSLPSMGYINVIPKTHLGLNGALLLIEQILNGLIF
ncbi:MAG: nitrogenase component 1 [Clostridiales bacterium]|nr:nitrogenase component 1 [Clostridiales bacterium]